MPIDGGAPGNDYNIIGWWEAYVKEHIRKEGPMLAGNLSDELAPAIGIRFERLIRTEAGKLNRATKGFIENISSVHANVYIVTTESERKAHAFLLKWKVPYSKVIKADTELEIADIAREHEMVSYYDLDKEILYNLNTRGNKRTKGELWSLGPT